SDAMNSLVAYGDESDEESPRRRHSNEGINPLKPRRGSHSQPTDRSSVSPDSASSQSRQRKDSDFFYDEEMPEEEREDDGNTEDGFREPAPPRGHHDSDSDSPEMITGGSMIKHVSSTASLSGFERDTFEKEDARLESTGDKKSRDEEPAPPVRQSMDEDDEEEIDRQLEECKDLLKVGPSSEGCSQPATPQYDSSPKEFEGPATPRAQEEARPIVIPPAPDTPVDAAVEDRFRVMFERKAKGHSINQDIQNRKAFKNPSIYEMFIEQFEIKEFGSNFPREQYDPDGYTQECYYDYISRKQNEAIHKSNAASAAKKAGDAPAAKKPKV
ncbi:hypothetical protein PRIPAC_74035, partial [Pristionchus pacificus]